MNQLWGDFFQLTEVLSFYDLALDLMPHGFHHGPFEALLSTSRPLGHALGMLSHSSRTPSSAEQLSPLLPIILTKAQVAWVLNGNPVPPFIFHYPSFYF